MLQWALVAVLETCDCSEGTGFGGRHLPVWPQANCTILWPQSPFLENRDEKKILSLFISCKAVKVVHIFKKTTFKMLKILKMLASIPVLQPTFYNDPWLCPSVVEIHVLWLSLPEPAGSSRTWFSTLLYSHSPQPLWHPLLLCWRFSTVPFRHCENDKMNIQASHAAVAVLSPFPSQQVKPSDV